MDRQARVIKGDLQRAAVKQCYIDPRDVFHFKRESVSVRAEVQATIRNRNGPVKSGGRNGRLKIGDGIRGDSPVERTNGDDRNMGSGSVCLGDRTESEAISV